MPDAEKTRPLEVRDLAIPARSCVYCLIDKGATDALGAKRADGENMLATQSYFPRVNCWAASIAGAALLATTGILTATAAPMQQYVNEKYGFSLQVPADLFVEGDSRNPEAGNIWVSRDGRARLSAVAGPNETGGTMESYRRFVMGQTYAGARFTYTPASHNWFVLSGIKDDQVFYERITFVCDGRYIFGWQMFYPVSEKRFYDRIVEEIHSSYRIAYDRQGGCD